MTINARQTTGRLGEVPASLTQAEKQVGLRRVLFVDDDPAILDGLKNLLRRERKRWEMVFALGGQMALDEIAASPFDVIVSDMRMPGIDGAALLERVKREHPSTARIVLSGHAEREAVMRAVPVAHQFLSKPCDADLLRTVVDRAMRLQDRIASPLIRELVGRIERLPSGPDIYWQLTQCIQRDDTGITDIAAIVERDPAMSTKVLQLVNSAFFGLARPTTSVVRAVGYLGVDLLRSLALTQAVFSASKGMPRCFDMERFQARSVLRARIASRIARQSPADVVVTAAMLSSIGELVLALANPTGFAEIEAESRWSKRSRLEVEKEVLGLTQADVGSYLLSLWGLPLAITEAVAFHLEPSALGQREPGNSSAVDDTIVALHVAHGLLSDNAGSDMGLDLDYVGRVRGLAELPSWKALAQAELERSS